MNINNFKKPKWLTKIGYKLFCAGYKIFTSNNIIWRAGLSLPKIEIKNITKVIWISTGGFSRQVNTQVYRTIDDCWRLYGFYFFSKVIINDKGN